jgi:two-component system, OmpR family, sensor histidine kinase CpxA
MKRGLSLRWKILAWFFVNLALIGGGIALFLRAQFLVGIESLLAGPTGARLDAIAIPLASELRNLSEDEWAGVLDRVVGDWRARGVKAALFRNDARCVAGDFSELPAEVRTLLAAHDSKMRGPGGPGGGGRGRPPGERGEFPPDRGGARRGPPPGDRPPSQEFLLTGANDEPGPPRERPPRREPPPEMEMRDGLPPPPGRGPGPGGPGYGPPPRDIGNLPVRLEKFMLIAGNPRLYWAGVHLDNPAGRFSATLFLASDSLRGGGLFFDYVPWLWLAGGILVGSALLWWPFVRRLTRSITRLTSSAEGIAEGNFDPPPETRRADELGRLHNAHRHMAQRLDGYVAGQKRFLGDTAHELLSPLARLEVALSILEQRTADEDRSYTERALGEVRHMAALVQELLTYSKSALSASAAKLEPVALARILGDAVQREGGDSQIEISVADDLRVLAAPALLTRAIGNIIRNAVRYAGGLIRISAEPCGDRIHLTISDEGPGVPPDALARIFDPFFRPDTSRTIDTGGTGLVIHSSALTPRARLTPGEPVSASRS